VASFGLLGLIVLTLTLLPGTVSANTSRTSDLSIDKIQAVFSDPGRATTYSVAVHESDAAATLGYQWTLTLEAVDPSVDIDGLTFDANCDNHGMLTEPTRRSSGTTATRAIRFTTTTAITTCRGSTATRA